MKISQEIQNILAQAKNSDEWVDACEKHGLKTRAVSGDNLVLFAWMPDSYSDRIRSPDFCTACGTADLPKPVTWHHCVACAEKFLEEDSQYFIPVKNAIWKHLSDEECEVTETSAVDPWVNAHHIPDHVIAGERHDDKMALFRNEY